MAIFSIFFLAIQARKISFTIFYNDKTPFQAIKTRTSKSRKIDILATFFSCNKARKMFFTIFQNEKTLFQAIKTISSKSGKLTWFWSKNGHFGNFNFFRHYRPGKCFTIFQKAQTPFQAIKRRSSKSPKIDNLSKGFTHGFGPKMAILETFFFRQYRSGKCLSPYSKTKKRLCRLKKKQVQKLDELTFYQRG